MGDEEVFVDLTSEEVLVVTELLDVEPPPGVGAESLAELAIGGEPSRLRDAALRSLRTRGIVTGGDRPEVAPPVQAVIGPFASPGVMVAAAFEQRGLLETRFYAAQPEIAIEHRGLSVSLHRFTPFATRDLLSRVMRYVDLRPSIGDDPVVFTVQEDRLDTVAERLDGQDTLGAVEELMKDGVAQTVAERFVDGLRAKRTSSSITILHRPTEDSVEGGSLSWIDAGLAGLWVTDVDAQSDDRVEIRLADARSVAAELLSYLPEAFGDHGVGI
jgi:hypothetical protein